MTPLLTVADVCEILRVPIPDGTRPSDGVFGATIDSRRVQPGDVFIALPGKHEHGEQYVDAALAAGASIAIVSGKAGGHGRIHVENCLDALDRLAAAIRERSQATWVAVTGSVGKTTTREIIASLLGVIGSTHRTPENFNNHLGVPMTMLGVRDEHQYAVIEIGTSCPGEVAALGQLVQPNGAVITAVTESHLDGLETIEGVLREKLSLVQAVESGGWVVIPDDSHLGDGLSCCQHPVVIADEWAAHLNEQELTTITNSYESEFCVPLLGSHLGKLVPIAILAAEQAAGRSLTSEELQEGLSQLVPVSGRCCPMQVLGRTVIDDSYNANPASMLAAFQTLSQYPTNGQRVALLGDMLGLGSAAAAAALHDSVARQLPDNIDCVLSVGEFAACWGAKTLVFQSNKELVEAYHQHTTAGDVVLVKGSRGMHLDDVLAALRQRGR